MWDIIGHESAVTLLDRVASSGEPAHAYLFLGPPGIGKTELARRFAAVLNCTGEPPPCGVCSNCRKIAAGSHPDVQAIVAGDADNPNAKLIKIDRLRELIHDATTLPVEGLFRVIILDADAVQAVQSSALLKTLEEPGVHVVFILMALAEDSLPDTIVSRCQVLHLRPATLQQVSEALAQRMGLSPERALELARLAGGRPGRALDLARDPAIVARDDSEIEQLLKASQSSMLDLLALAGTSGASADKARATLVVWGSWWRDSMLLSIGCGEAVANRRRLADLERFVASRTTEQLGRQLGAIERTARLIGSNVNSRLAMENLALDLAT